METTSPPPTHPGGGQGQGQGGHHAGIFTFAFVASALVLVCVLRALNYFSARTNPLSVKTQVFLSWTLSVSILTLVPLDVGYSLNRTNDDEGGNGRTMGAMWGLTYWSTFFLTWVILPLHQIYEDRYNNFFSLLRRVFLLGRSSNIYIYISVSSSTSIFNRSVLLCRPCLRRGVLTTFLFILTASRAAATLRSRRGVPPR